MASKKCHEPPKQPPKKCPEPVKIEVCCSDIMLKKKKKELEDELLPCCTDDLGIDVDKANKKAKKLKEEILVIEKVPRRPSDISQQLSVPNLLIIVPKEPDPMQSHLADEEKQNKLEEKLAQAEKNIVPPLPKITPDLPVRIELAKPVYPIPPYPKYVYPESKKQKREKLERRRKAELDRNFCKFDVIQIATPVDAITVEDKMEVPSPDVSKAQVVPRSPSLSITEGMPELPDEKDIALRKPKSGIIINAEDAQPVVDELDSFDLLFQRKPRPHKGSHHSIRSKSKKSKKLEKIKEEEEKALNDKYNTEQRKLLTAIIDESKKMGDGEDDTDDHYLTKMFRKKVEQVSKSTSLNSRDLADFVSYEEEDLEAQPYMTKIIQKFRRDSEAQRYKIPPRKVKHGTLESHSFTKLLQPTLKEFYFGLMMGAINQSHEFFAEASRGVQGICMPVAAYCYSILVHPTTWVEGTIDEIVEAGDKLYYDSIAVLHNHEYRKELRYLDLNKYCFIGEKKVKFQVYEPEIIGQVRSTDKKIYNLSKGLKLFFQRHRAGIFKTFGLDILIWKDKHYFVFDAVGRTKNFVQDVTEGKALLANFYDVASIATVLLDNANLPNWPYTISKISVFTIMEKDAEEEEFPSSLFKEQSEYNILNENKAVVQGSFDLGDLCFDFTRNRQSIAMAAICLVYTKITPPSAWHRTTIDKIMIIGNQLYLELVESEQTVEMVLEHLPAVFTLGPYLVEIVIYSKVKADLMFRRNICVLNKVLDKFFKTNSMAILCIGKFVLAIWKQRGMIYCFDPYSRNNEALKCRNGSACVSMNATVETLVETIAFNFDTKDEIFYLSALKVLKINRDPAQAHLFPRTMTMDQYNPETFKTCRMKKTNKKAVKTVTANFAEPAVRALLPWNFLEESYFEVGSTVESFTKNQMPAMVHKYASRAVLRAGLPEVEKPIDLDSPSLSDTQIEPDRPAPIQGDEGIDLDNWELTMEELDLEDDGEGEEGEGEEIYRETFMVMSEYAQVHEDSLDSYHKKMSAEVNTDITFCFLPITREILPPTNMHDKQKLLKERQLKIKRQLLIQNNEMMEEPPVTKSQELAKETNFIDLPDGSQLIKGTANITEFGKDFDYIAPFVCIMAAAVAKKYALLTWSPDVIDYTLKSGAELYKLSKVRFDQVPILEVPKVSLGKTDYSILSEYLYDTTMKQRILEITLEKVLFRKHECGLIVTPSYACTVFFKNHLYYLYDCYGCNGVGLGVGRDKKGVACFSRFQNIHDMASRIMYNKLKRDSAEDYDFSRFVLSYVKVTILPKIKPRRKVKGFGGEDGGEDDDSEASKAKPKPKLNKVGYQLNNGVFTIQGTVALENRAEASPDALKEDHFVCLCAALMLICYPILKWDTKRVDYVMEQGKHVFSHADNLEVAEKRFIRNILIHKNFFDIIVTTVRFGDWNKNKNISVGLDTVFNKRDLVIIQFPNCCYVLYKHNDTFHMFDPYASNPDGTSSDGEGNAGWTLFENIKLVKKRIKSQILPDSEAYKFYTFEVSSVRKAPKKIALAQIIMEYDVNKPLRAEPTGRPFNEKDSWLKSDIPWSRMKSITSSGQPRGDPDYMWHNWDIEYNNDLFSLAGTLHQTDEQFDPYLRGKQTLANLVTAIAMVKIYEFTEWNSNILDSIIVIGNKYFEESVAKISDKDYEIGLDDLNKTMTIFPFKAKVVFTPFLDGTIFLMRASQYNLYKGLRCFCDQYSRHLGIIYVTRGDGFEKRMVAFGKNQEHEYFMYDCQMIGPPMFLDKKASSYILRCKTLKRLVHVLTVTLRGGDFFIFEVNAGAFQTIK